MSIFSRLQPTAPLNLTMRDESVPYSVDAWQAFYSFAGRQVGLSHDASLLVNQPSLQAGIPKGWQGERVLWVRDECEPVAGAIASRDHDRLMITHVILPSRVHDWYAEAVLVSLLRAVAGLDEDVSFRLPVTKFGLGASRWQSPLERVLQQAGAACLQNCSNHQHADHAVTTAMLRAIIATHHTQ